MDSFWEWLEQQEEQQMCKQACDCKNRVKITPHKHAECIRAWLDGVPVQLQMPNGDWKLVSPTVMPSFDVGWEYRIKPEPVTDLEQL